MARWKNASCQRHYEKNKPQYVARAKAHRKLNRERVQAWIVRYLRAHPCVDCGITDILVLEFDHRGDAPKKFDVGCASTGKLGLPSVVREVSKCDVRCANCHRRKTIMQRGWTNKT